eukprot:g3364.t1
MKPTKTDVRAIWTLLDADGNGSVTAQEFLEFAWGLTSSNLATASTSARTNHARVIVKNSKTWWDSPRTATLRRLLIGYFQLLASVTKLYPMSGGGSGNATSNDADGPQQASWDGEANDFIGKAAAIASELDILVVSVFRCLFTGPRFSARLYMYTITPLLLCLGALIVPLAYKQVAIFRARYASSTSAPTSARIRRQVAVLKSHALSFIITVIFLLYPIAARYILSTFSCRTYEDGSASPPEWLDEDELVRCSLGDARYVTIYVYSLLMTIVIVIGSASHRRAPYSAASLQLPASGSFPDATRQDLMTILNATRFWGVSGFVSFDQQTLDRIGGEMTVQTWNSAANRKEDMGRYDPETRSFTFSRTIVWPGGVEANATNLTSAPSAVTLASMPGPEVHRVLPSSISPNGEAITIDGANFRTKGLVVTVGGSLCADVVFISSAQIKCQPKPGRGADHAVVVKDLSGLGQESSEHVRLSYLAAVITSISIEGREIARSRRADANYWAIADTIIHVRGFYFTLDVRCRVGGSVYEGGTQADEAKQLMPEGTATYVSDRRMTCKVPADVPSGANSRIEVSNDGTRWSSAFPYFLRACASNENYAAAMVHVMQAFGWGRAGILTSDDPFASDLGRRLSTEMKRHLGTGDLSVQHLSTFVEDRTDLNASVQSARQEVRKMKQVGARVIFMETLSNVGVDAALLALAEEGLLSSGYVLLGSIAMLKRSSEPRYEALRDGCYPNLTLTVSI